MYAKVALAIPVDQFFDYQIPEHLSDFCSIGSRVLVSFGRIKIIGYIIALTKSTRIRKIKTIIDLIDKSPILDEKFLSLARVVSDYYCCSLGEAIEAGLPTGVRHGLKVCLEYPKNTEFHQGSFQVNLIKGYDVSNRLKFYTEQINKLIDTKKEILILTPEIMQSIKISDFLKNGYGDRVAVTYRKQKIREELDVWEATKNGKVTILVGTRPAVFSPFSNLGLIVVDSEDGYGYKEEQAPYYHARDVAIMRARLERIPIILLSRAPSLESYYLATRKVYSFVDLKENKPTDIKVTVVDMKLYSFAKNKSKRILSLALEDKIGKALSNNKKIIVFINRKGFASIAYCQRCGYVLSCQRCSSKLTYYFEERKLICNSCGFKRELYTICPKCNQGYIKYSGIGIEKVINQLHLLFPKAKIGRLDKEHMAPNEDSEIIVATEMVLHQDRMNNADIVAIADLDNTINIINYRSSEKIYSLLYKLKNICKEELIIQTYLTDYFALKNLTNMNLENFYDEELKERKALKLPPFVHLAHINLRGMSQERTKLLAFTIYDKIMNLNKEITVFTPLEATPFKLRGKYRYFITLKSKNQPLLSKFIKKHLKGRRSSGIILTIDMDPQ